MDEATQLYVMLLARTQLGLLDGQALITLRRMKRKIRRQPRSYWVLSRLSADKRILYGHYDRLMYELCMEDQASFFNFLTMPPEMFDELLARIAPRIQKQDTRYRKALEPGLKLAVTIRHLASGDKYPSLQYDFRVARNTISSGSGGVPGYCRSIQRRSHFMS